jgi:hypothetical protein
MANYVITGKAEQTDESSYTVQSTGEVVTKIQLTLNVPGMQDRVLCELPLDVSPKPDILEQWEMEETWLVVSANTMRAFGLYALQCTTWGEGSWCTGDIPGHGCARGDGG